MRCLHCKGRLRRGTAPFHVDRGGYHVHWDALPAWVCDQCGEPMFDEVTVGAIQAALAALDSQTRALEAG
jgi:YgiT-type zinc finger domain-containing protein